MKRTIISSAVLALAISGVGVASAEKPAESGFKVTGGGQIVAEDTENAGDTVAFNAQELPGDDESGLSPDSDDAARGQFQYNPRGASEEQANQEATERFHGEVTCLLSGSEAVANEEAEEDQNEEEGLQEGMARFGGIIRDKEGPTRYFTVDVTDNGQGGDAKDDMILVRITAAPCADNPENEGSENIQEQLRLGRGNVKIHNNPDGTATPTSIALAQAAMVKMAGR